MRSIAVFVLALAACSKLTPSAEFIDAAPASAALTLATEDDTTTAGPLFAGATKVEIADVNAMVGTVVGFVDTGLKGASLVSKSATQHVWTIDTGKGIALRFTIDKLSDAHFNWLVEAKARGDYVEILRAQLARDNTIPLPGRGSGVLGIDLDAWNAVTAGTPLATAASGKVTLGFQHGPGGSHHRYRLDAQYFDVVHVPGRVWTLGSGTASLDALVSGPGGPEKFHARVRQINGKGGWSSAVAFGGRFPGGTAALARECWDAAGSLTYRRVWSCSYSPDGARRGNLDLASGCTLLPGAIQVGGSPASDTTGSPDDDANFAPLAAACLAGVSASRAELTASLSAEAVADLSHDANVAAGDASLTRGSASAGFQQGIAALIGASRGAPPPPEWPLPVQLCTTCYEVPARTTLSITASNERFVHGPGVDSINTFCAQPSAPCAGNFSLDGLADEHATVIPPPVFANHPGDFFLFADHAVLISSGPNLDGSWTFGPAADYGNYGGQIGPVFHQPMEDVGRGAGCPNPANDTTFDLNYATAGSVVIDPTAPTNASGEPALLMVYEGVNGCAAPSTASLGGYVSIAIATSRDGGRSWPMYANMPFSFPSTFNDGTIPGPNAGTGAVGANVCEGSVCSPQPPLPDTYGRYAVLEPPIPLLEIMNGLAIGQTLLGDEEPSAFVDPAPSGRETFLYVVANGGGKTGPFTWPGVAPGLTVARAPLQKGANTLSFMKWYDPDGNGRGFAPIYRSTCTSGVCPTTVCDPLHDPNCRNNTGLTLAGGLASPIFQVDPNADQTSPKYKHCLTALQAMAGPQISYVADRGLYLLTFVCHSPIDPLTGDPQYSDPKHGSEAWFFSTMDAAQYDLGQQGQWSAPQEIDGSQGPLVNVSCSGNGFTFDGWYPTFMSATAPAGTLADKGWVFYLNGPYGCVPRHYSTRQFAIDPAPSRCVNPLMCCVQAGGTFSGGHCQ